MYVISNGRSYIGVNADNVSTTVSKIDKALVFSEERKASNYRDNLKSTLRKFNWDIIKVEDKKSDEEPANIEDNMYEETELEKSGFNIAEFFDTTVKTISQLREYARNMKILESEYNDKILDVRHYKRDFRTKLNAIQLQRLEQFEIMLERERYECKSNRLIAEFFLTDFNQMENINCMEFIRNVKESQYKPKILTYELLDGVVGKKGR